MANRRKARVNAKGPGCMQPYAAGRCVVIIGVKLEGDTETVE